LTSPPPFFIPSSTPLRYLSHEPPRTSSLLSPFLPEDTVFGRGLVQISCHLSPPFQATLSVNYFPVIHGLFLRLFYPLFASSITPLPVGRPTVLTFIIGPQIAPNDGSFFTTPHFLLLRDRPLGRSSFHFFFFLLDFTITHNKLWHLFPLGFTSCLKEGWSGDRGEKAVSLT